MRGRMKKAAILFLAACVWSLCGGAVAAEPQSGSQKGSDFLFSDGDVVGFIGDSITHVEYLPVSYVELLDNYYLSHYPERDIEFRNLGMAGYTVRDILGVYDVDPAFRGINKAVILLGMNDSMQKISTEEYLVNLEELIGRLKGDGLSGEDILVLSPTPYDQTCGINYDRNGFPYQTTDTGLEEYTAALPGRTAQWGVRYVDLHTPMKELSLEIQKENDRDTLTVGDCIHPDLEGHWMIVYEILKAQGADFSGSLKDEYLELYSNGSKGECWNWKLGRISIAGDEGYERLCSIFPEARLLSQEKLREIESLEPEQAYIVTVDGENLGTFLGSALEEGVDLAAVEEKPWEEAAEQIAKRNQERHHNAAVYRAALCAARAEDPDLTEDRMRIRYTAWKTEDNRLREEMRAFASEAVSREYAASITEEGYPPEELWQEAKRAAEEKQAEEEQKVVEERRAAEEQRAREAKEIARNFQEDEDARRHAEAEVRQKRKAARIAGACAGAIALLAGAGIWRKARKHKKF